MSVSSGSHVLFSGSSLTIQSGSLNLSFGQISNYNNITTSGSGVPIICGIDNRSGITSADGAAINLYSVPAGITTGLFRITSDIYATAFTSGTATYTITWTENAQAKTMVVNATAINVLGTAIDLINPDVSTNIT